MKNLKNLKNRDMFRDIFFDYIPEILGELYFRFGIDLIPENKDEIDIGGIKKVCVFATSGIGNLIMLVPMLRSLKNADVKVTVVVVSEAAAEIIQGSQIADEVVVYNKYPKRSLFKKLRDEWYDLTIAATHLGYMRAKEAFRTGARNRIGFRYPYRDRSNLGFFLTHPLKFEPNIHEVEQNFQLLQPLGIEMPANLDLGLSLPVEDLKFADDFLSSFGVNEGALVIGFHTGSDTEPNYRSWQKEKFAQLGDKLASEYKAKILIVGGKAEERTVDGIIRLMSHEQKPISAVGKTTLTQTAALIKRCQLFVSNDSGPMHLAAAVKTPTIGIFGPTDHIAHAPYGKECYLVKSSISCSPCHLPHSDGYGCGEVDCFRLVSVSNVYELAKRVLSKILSRGT